MHENINQVHEMFESGFKKVQETLHELSRSKHEEQTTRQDLDKMLRDFSVFATRDKSIVFDAPDRNKRFTGRQKELESLERCLLSENSDHKFRMAAICGLGGCGKTTLAAQFAWEHKPQYEGGVFWFSMEDEEKFESCVNDLALRLGLMEKSSDLTLARILTLISKQEKLWLIVLDNVDQPVLSEKMRKVLRGIWKRESNGHMLITTRRERKEICRCVDLEPNCFVEITSFTTEEAKEFLLSHFSGENAGVQEDALNELVVELGCLPLALEQAGAHIKSLGCTVNEYLKQYKLERFKLLSEHRANPSREYDSLNRLSVHTTWLLNFEYVRNSKYGEIATRFVHAAAFLDPDEIYEGLINAEMLSSDVVSKNKIELPLTNNHIVEVLTKFSLFQRKSAGCIKVHRLVQQVIRGTITSKEVEKAVYTTFQLLKKAAQSPGESATDKSVFSIIRHWLALKRHVEQQLRATPDDSSAEKVAALMKSGSREIVFQVSRTIKGLSQTLENRRGLLALLDVDYDEGLDIKGPIMAKTESTPVTLPSRYPSRFLLGSPSGLPSRLPSGLPSRSHLGSSSGSPSGFLSGSSSGLPSGLRSELPSGLPSGSHLGSSSGSPSGLLSGAPFGLPQEWSLETGSHLGSSSGSPSGLLPYRPQDCAQNCPQDCPLGSHLGSSSGSPSGSLSGAPFGLPQEWSLDMALRPPTRITTSIARRIAMIFLCGNPRSRRSGHQ